MHTRSLVILVSTALFLAASNSSAVTDFGTDGVNNTNVVKKIVQITDDTRTDQMKMLGGRTWPQAANSGLDPWSRDGQWIAFTARMDGTGEQNEEICKIQPDGTGFARLTANAVSDSNASFGTDGKIYYSHYSGAPDNRYEVWRIDATGSNATNLSAAHAAATNEYNPRISPDGTKIAYVKNNILWVANNDGTAETRVSGKRADLLTDIAVDRYRGYSWSPDSQYLAFSGNDGVTGTWIYVVRSDGSDAGSYVPSITQPPFTLFTTYQEWPEFSPDGTKIAFLWREYEGAPNYYNNYNLRVVKVDGGEQKVLDTASSNPLYTWKEMGGPFRWSPDSKWLAYRKDFNTGTSLYQMYLFMVDPSQSTPAPVQLTKDYNDFFPVWDPGGKRILFQSWGGSGANVPSREDPANGDTGDLLLMYINVKFPWHMFLPAIENNAN